MFSSTLAASSSTLAASSPGYQRRSHELEPERVADVFIRHAERTAVDDLVLETAAAEPRPKRRPPPPLSPADRPGHRVAARVRDAALEVEVSNDVGHRWTDVHRALSFLSRLSFMAFFRGFFSSL
jgi:hypothetical protein